jgi:phosphatidate phosphatase APP1
VASRRTVLAAVLACACPSAASEPGDAPASKPRAHASTREPPALTQEQKDAIADAAARSPIKADEEVQLFPIAAWLDESAGLWRFSIRGWIYEPETDDLMRTGIVVGLQEALDDDPRVRSGMFESRVRPFLVDNESGKSIALTFAGEVLQMSESGGDGHIVGEGSLDADTARRWADERGVIDLKVVTRPGDTRTFATRIHLVAPAGLTILSDIDDTVKVTNVVDKRACLESTFLEPFRAVDGMADVYTRWLGAAPDGHLHFVSSSPWQLLDAIEPMLDGAGFPASTFALKAIRPKSLDVIELFADPMRTKPVAIDEALARWPGRTFVLVGDSGEKDPEVYGDIARRHPGRIAFIAIRDVTGEDAKASRYATAFADVAVPWEIFTDPSALPRTLPPA